MAATGTSIEVDPSMLGKDGEFSDYATSGYDTSTQSLSSSINAYVFENGRRYHSYFGVDKNMQPTDEIEQDRLDMHHEILLLLLQRKLHRSPLKDPQRILDVGTGTGIWAIDMADQYPEAEVIGIDLSPIQPVWVPPNCRFEVDDAEKEWTFRENYFDLIHIRNITQGIDDWSKVMASAFRCAKPGSYVELNEIGLSLFSDDGTLKPDNPMLVWFSLAEEALTKIGRPNVTKELLSQRLTDAGFVDIKMSEHKQPFGPWPKNQPLKTIGNMMLLNGESAFHAYGMAMFTRILKMENEEADKICKAAHKAMYNKNTHSYNKVYVVYGRKPLPDEVA